MQQEDYISTLPQEEQKALAICGIYKSSQLSSVSIQALMSDIRMARETFPDDMISLTNSRMYEIYAEATHTQLPLNETDDQSQAVNLPPPQSETLENFPRLVISRRSRPSRRREKSANDSLDVVETVHDKSHCIRSGRPLRIYFGAWCVVLFYIDLLAWFIVPSLMLTGILELPPKIVIAALVAGMVPYYFLARRASCTVCNMRIYDRRNFPKNRFAHYIPLLGHVLATALHVIFCMWFRCPACGTPQRLIRRTHRH